MRRFRRSLGGAYICRKLQKWRDMFNQLTQKDIEAMEAEIEERKLVIRPRLLEAVKEARAHGDLSENFEYYAAKREKNKNESRIRFLEKMIKTAEVISDSSEEDEVGMNKTVEVEFPDMESARAFLPPAWLGREVTDDEKYHNSNMSTRKLK